MANGRVDEHFAWGSTQVRWLYANGRGFDERTHAHTGIYDHRSTSTSSDDPVPLELALDHRYRGLGVVVVEPVGDTSPEGLITELEAGPVTDLLAVDAVDQLSSWTARPMRRSGAQPAAPMSLGTDGGRPDRIVQLVFLERDPELSWDAFRDYGTAVDGTGAGRVTFAAPFLPTVVGTDTYTDELW